MKDVNAFFEFRYVNEPVLALVLHEKHQEREAREYWQEIAENFPELARDAQRELQWLDQLAQDRPQRDPMLMARSEKDTAIRARDFGRVQW